MAKYELNEAAVAYVRGLIDRRQYVLDSDWGDSQPSAERQNAYLERHSWEEYALLKGRYPDAFTVIAVWASPETRYHRLATRAVRPLTREEAISRDIAEIENTNKGGPIAMADFIIVNESSVEDMRREVERIITRLK